jgi:hypothetical protein
MAKKNTGSKAKATAAPTPDGVVSEWATVFDAYPEVNEIYVGTNTDGFEQPFLERVHAVNFAGNPERVKLVKRNAALEAPAAEGEPADENTGEEGGEAADNADETGEEGGE